MRRVAIHGREVSEEVSPEIMRLINALRKNDMEISVSHSFGMSKYQSLFEGLPRFDSKAKPGQFDCFVSLGGDGTFLESLTYVGASHIPILGINTGRLGFLAPIPKKKIEFAIGRLLAGEYSIDERSLVSLNSNQALFDDNYALNEFAIMRKDTSSMIVVTSYINGDYLSSYWADGLMVSTPTGSTGYSLSCGGPIIMPQSRNLIITPVSPHNLNVRPLVLPDACRLTFKVDSRNTNFLVSLDSRSATVNDHITLEVTRADFVAKLIKIEGYSLLETLRAKLSWGFDRRN